MSAPTIDTPALQAKSKRKPYIGANVYMWKAISSTVPGDTPGTTRTKTTLFAVCAKLMLPNPHTGCWHLNFEEFGVWGHMADVPYSREPAMGHWSWYDEVPKSYLEG